MTEQPNHLDPVEALWQELREAESAGVLRRTVVPSDVLRESNLTDSIASITPAPPAWVLQLRRRWVSVAACLLLAVGVWSFLFSREINRLRDQSDLGLIARGGSSVTPEDQFSVGCLTGPGGRIDDRCRSFDLDTDGQITLADFRAHQLALALPAN